MMAQVFWHGTDEERTRLLAALSNNCTCEYDETNAVRLVTCPAHKALLEDQAFLDRVLFERRIAGRLKQEEFRN